MEVGRFAWRGLSVGLASTETWLALGSESSFRGEEVNNFHARTRGTASGGFFVSECLEHAAVSPSTQTHRRGAEAAAGAEGGWGGWTGGNQAQRGFAVSEPPRGPGVRLRTPPAIALPSSCDLRELGNYIFGGTVTRARAFSGPRLAIDQSRASWVKNDNFLNWRWGGGGGDVEAVANRLPGGMEPPDSMVIGLRPLQELL